MGEERETDQELLDQHKRVEKRFAEAKASAERTKPGGNRDRKMRFAGSLNFTLLGIESELRDRGLVN